MAGQLDLLNGIMQGFRQGAMDGEEIESRRADRKLKELEMEARRNSEAEQKKRQKFADAMNIRQSGFQTPELAEGQDLYDVDPSEMKYDPQYLAMKSREGRAQAGYDPYGEKAAKAEEAQIKLQSARANAGFNNLPKDQQIVYESTAKDIGAKKNIARYITSSLQQLKDPSKSQDEKLLIGREILKSLNSVQGADAVGAEESKRLGSLLEFKIIPRIGEPGNMFGRDLDLFTTQVENNAGRLTQSAQSAQAELDAMTAGGAPAMRTDGLVPAGMIQKPGLINQAANAVVPKAGASGNKIKVTNGKETYFIEPKDLNEAMSDGFKQVR